MIQTWQLIVAVIGLVCSGAFGLALVSVRITNTIHSAKADILKEVAELNTRVAVLETRVDQTEERLNRLDPGRANGHAAGMGL